MKQKMAAEVKEKYKDPPNKEIILQQMKNAPTLGDVRKIITDIFPDWEVGVFDNFCENYPHLSSNWKTICEGIGVPCTQILIGSEIFFDSDKDNQILYHYSECLTKVGFAVRSMIDYTPCCKCEKILIPTPHAHQKMKELGLKVPEININTCYRCR